MSISRDFIRFAAVGAMGTAVQRKSEQSINPIFSQH